ncbi:NAD-P-binding protein [Trametes coccinea BRFM310]|uniref:NAD-P-binding protein n=1 Tax=Trametes coccinea (strain BRFM310) TaxID=1353009 RepID=A0A1Y2IUF2_TRAC3|nr:NAD-P-binding protein [Trametes coccinea BRFM310]
MSFPNTILVTGASGFIGSHVTLQLLDAGYRVRGAARGAKVDLLKQRFGSDKNFEVIEITDVAAGDLTIALHGVDAIIHTASPLAGRQSTEDALNSIIEGTMNIIRQAHQAGVSKVVLTSSWATTIDPSLADTFAGVTTTEKNWGKTSREDLLTGNRDPLYVYCGAKLLAERSAWDFAAEHRELDLATINPPFVYGRPVEGLATGTGIMSLGTNALIYQLIAGEPGRPLPPQLPPFFCHVRDVARAHVLALKLPKLPDSADVQDKRFIVAGRGAILWPDAVKLLLEKRPQLKDRLPTLENAPPLPGPLAKVDTTRAAEVLGMKEYVGLEETLLETIDALLQVEKYWN